MFIELDHEQDNFIRVFDHVPSPTSISRQKDRKKLKTKKIFTRYLYMSVISSGKFVSLWCLNPTMNGWVKTSYLQGKCYGCTRLTANYKHASVGILLCACFLCLVGKEWASFLAFVLSTPKNSSCKKLPWPLLWSKCHHCQNMVGSLLYTARSWISKMETCQSTSLAWISLHNTSPVGNNHQLVSSLKRFEVRVVRYKIRSINCI